MSKQQEYFDALVRNCADKNAKPYLQEVAVAFWSGRFMPALNGFSSTEKSQAAFLLDKLSRYHCVAAEQKLLARKLLNELESQLGPNEPHHSPSDELARKWSAPSDFKLAFRSLLPLQRRHTRSYK